MNFCCKLKLGVLSWVVWCAELFIVRWGASSFPSATNVLLDYKKITSSTNSINHKSLGSGGEGDESKFVQYLRGGSYSALPRHMMDKVCPES